MFTGIVQAVGRIVDSAPRGDGVRLAIDAPALDTADVRLGDSIAVAGCCLTVVEIGGSRLRFDVSAESLRCTAGLALGRAVNLEKALRLSDRLGGHLMTGHVDGVGLVTRFEPVGAADGSYTLEIEAPADVARYVAPKGSIAVDGTSLTVNAVSGARFTVNLIPHTLAVTTLHELVPGRSVNLEVDLIARYVARLTAYDAGRG